MKKNLYVVVNGDKHLIRYQRRKSETADIVYDVETDIANIEKFHFFIKNGKAGFLLTIPHENDMKAQIIKQINANE